MRSVPWNAVVAISLNREVRSVICIVVGLGTVITRTVEASRPSGPQCKNPRVSPAPHPQRAVPESLPASQIMEFACMPVGRDCKCLNNRSAIQ